MENLQQDLVNYLGGRVLSKFYKHYVLFIYEPAPHTSYLVGAYQCGITPAIIMSKEHRALFLERCKNVKNGGKVPYFKITHIPIVEYGETGDTIYAIEDYPD